MPTANLRLTTDGREFRDSNGSTWRVGERLRPGPDGGRRAILVFESHSSFRCVTSYPPNWESLSDDALEALSWKI